MLKSTAINLLLCASALWGAGHKTQNVIILMSDGVRWQDVFEGVDPQLLTADNAHSDNIPRLKRQFARPNAKEQRRALMPFLWSEIAKKGQIYGNRALDSDVHVANGLQFSYPGYSETLCGFVDPKLNTNDKIPNPNVTVLEWLWQKDAYKNRIAAFSPWGVMPYILNTERSAFYVNAGYDLMLAPPVTPEIEMLNRIRLETASWDGEVLDAPVFYTALAYWKLHKPKVLFISLGDTDVFGHDGRYDLYLEAVHRYDDYARLAWETAQSMDEYKGKTTLILAVDHGRGNGESDWIGHGLKHPDSKNTWFAVIGPDTPAKGERAKTQPITQTQFAATIATLLGEDYNSAVPQAGKPIADVVGRSIR